MKLEVSLELMDEMAECIYDCSWVSSEEIAAYMKSCISDSQSYDPEDWSVNGRGLVAIDKTIDLKNKQEIVK